jgi:uncharacterized delta-60 repeat protein
MKNTAHAGNPARIRIVAPTAAVATGLVTPLALAGPGDLDPAFGKVGRVSDLPDFGGSAWSLDARDGDILFGGFDDYCYYYCDYDDEGFVSRLNSDGGLDEAFAAFKLQNTDVRDVAMLPDGRAVAVATRLDALPQAMVVFRLRTDGTLDTSFGIDGTAQISAPAGVDAQGTSLLLESDGRITVAGVQGGKLALARLLPNGSPDTSFGTDGSFVWDESIDLHPLPKLVRVGGGYRVLVQVRRAAAPGSAVHDCRVLALTENGALDSSYGSGGLSVDVVVPAANGSRCTAIGAQRDGRVVVAGSSFGDSPQVFAARLLSTGTVDPLFRADTATAGMSDVTALAVGADDSIALAGRDKSGLPGALIVRLQADGMLDLVFGRNGFTTIGLESDSPQWPSVHDMQVQPDGAIVMSGGGGPWWSATPFVARLLGNASGGGPGVADVVVTDYEARETDGSVGVNVRRIGGRTGALSVQYETVSGSATAGEDFGAVTGQLTWADGEDSDKAIMVPIFKDSGPPESGEVFYVRLVETGGGVGIATSNAWVTILGDSYPAGLLTLRVYGQAGERDLTVNVIVDRVDYVTGAVAVDLTVGGTATNGEDYSLPQQTYRFSWADGEGGARNLSIPLISDRRKEDEETITLTLSGATGGALIAEPASATVRILDDDASSSGGGGHSGGFFAILAGLAGLLRLRRRPIP